MKRTTPAEEIELKQDRESEREVEGNVGTKGYRGQLDIENYREE